MDKKSELNKPVLLWSIIFFASCIFLLSCKQPVDSFKRDNIHDPVNANYNSGSASGLSISFDNDGIITIAWADTAHYEDGFIIEKSLNDTANFKEIGRVEANVTSYQDSSKYLRKDTYYRVSAFVKRGGSEHRFESAVKKMKPLAKIASFSNNFDRSAKSLQLSWNVNSPFATGYRLEYRKNPTSEYILIKNLAPNINQFTDKLSDISFDDRQYRLSVLLSGNNFEDIIASDTSNFHAAIFYPTDLSINIQNEQTVNLNWKDNSYFEAGFKIYRSTSQDAGTFKLIKTIQPDMTKYQDQLDLRNNISYTYRIKAYTDSSESGNQEKKITFSIPTPTLINDRYTNTQNNAISLSWNISSDQLVNKYILERKTVSANGWTEIGTFSKNTTSYTDTGIDPARGYVYRIRTISSDYSNELELYYRTLFNKTATFNGYSTRISDLDFSPDGHYIVSSSSYGLSYGDPSVDIWDLGSKSLFKKIDPGAKAYTGVDFSNDGNQLAIASWFDFTVKVYDFPSVSLLKTFTGDYGTYDVKFSPDDKFIATAGGYGDVRKWDLATGNLVFHYSGYGSPIFTPHHLAFKPDGTQIAVDDNDMVVIDATTGGEIKRLETKYDYDYLGNNLNFNKDGSKLAYSLIGLTIYNTTNWVRIFSGTNLGFLLYHPAFNPSNNDIIASVKSKYGSSILFLNTNTQEIINKLTASDIISNFTYSTDGSMIAVGLNNGSIEIWKKSTQKGWKVVD